MKRRPEETLQRHIVTWCAMQRLLCVAVPNAAVRRAGGRAGNAVPGLLAGFPDLLVFPGDGRVVALEVKAPPKILPSGKPSLAAPRISEEQLHVMNLLNAVGVSTYVVRSVEQVAAIAKADKWLAGRAI